MLSGFLLYILLFLISSTIIWVFAILAKSCMFFSVLLKTIPEFDNDFDSFLSSVVVRLLFEMRMAFCLCDEQL